MLIYVQRLRRFPMYLHHRVYRHNVWATVGAASWGRGALAQLLHWHRQFRIGLIQIGPHGVATKFRHFNICSMDDRRLILKGDVGMPLVRDTTVGGGQLKNIRVIGERVFRLG